MKIIISPAKKMTRDLYTSNLVTLPVFLEKTTVLKDYIKSLTFEQAKELWKCNDHIAQVNFGRFISMNLIKNLEPALLSYVGIQYQTMAPNVFTNSEWRYVNRYLRIMSGFYGILSPQDGVVPYRLEMQAKIDVEGCKNLYDFWGDHLFEYLVEENDCIINLASKEYSKCIERPLSKLRKQGKMRYPDFKYITCNFCEYDKNHKLVQRATQAKIARGEMVRYMAENNVKDVEQIKNFDRLGYSFNSDVSDEETYVFIK